MFIGGNMITWRSKKQNVVALSSAEAEFQGMAKGLCEFLWLKRLLTEIGFAPNCEMKYSATTRPQLIFPTTLFNMIELSMWR
jgi:hypothetical protein